jgi:hypothetical protein
MCSNWTVGTGKFWGKSEIGVARQTDTSNRWLEDLVTCPSTKFAQEIWTNLYSNAKNQESPRPQNCLTSSGKKKTPGSLMRISELLDSGACRWIWDGRRGGGASGGRVKVVFACGGAEVASGIRAPVALGDVVVQRIRGCPPQNQFGGHALRALDFRVSWYGPRVPRAV